MDNSNKDFERELSALRAEVKRLRLLIEGAILIIGIGLVVLVPQLLIVGIALAVLILFGFLVSRQRRMIFDSLFKKSSKDEG